METVDIELPVIIISYLLWHVRCPLTHRPWLSSKKFIDAQFMFPSCCHFCFSYVPLWCLEIHLLLYAMLNWEKMWGHSRTYPRGSENHSSSHTGPQKPMLSKDFPPCTVIAPLSTTSKMQVLCTSTSHKYIWGSVVTFPQGLTWMRTGCHSSFSGNIHTKASTSNSQFPDAFYSMKSCSPLGGQLTLGPVLF